MYTKFHEIELDQPTWAVALLTTSRTERNEIQTAVLCIHSAGWRENDPGKYLEYAERKCEIGTGADLCTVIQKNL